MVPGATHESPVEGCRPSTAIALDLGWEMAELFCDASPRATEPARREDLPTLSDLVPWQRCELALEQVAGALHRLGPAASAAGLALPSIDAVSTAFNDADESALRDAIYDLHLRLLSCLHATEANLGKAYDLGRSLAYTCRRPIDADSLRAEFAEHRLETLSGWLADLASALPDHAARAVAISLGLWQESIPDPQQKTKRWQVKDEAQRRTIAELHRQAKLWRAVLTGEKVGSDMLEPMDYVGAAGRLCWRALRLTWRFLWRTAFLVPLMLGAGGVVAWLIVTSSGVHVAIKILGAVGAGVAALGITWKGTAATLGQIAAKLEHPLWDAELDVAIGVAITTVGRGRFAPPRSRTIARVSPSGPVPAAKATETT